MINNNHTTRRSSRCLWLLLIPVFFFSAYLYMGKRAKRDNYTKLGIFFGIASLLTFAVSLLGLVWPRLFYGLITHAIAWALCAINTLNCRQQYWQLVEWEEEDAKPDELVNSRSFRLRNALFALWNVIPFLGGYSTFMLGRKMNNTALKWAGIGSTVISVAVVMTLLLMGQTTSNLPISIALFWGYCSYCIHPLLAGYFFPEYLKEAATQWREDVEHYPQMERAKWRICHSLWQILTVIPYFGSIGLFIIGIMRESGKVLLGASVLCVLEFACIAVPPMVLENQALLQAYPFLAEVAAGLSVFWFVAYSLNIFYGALIRRDMLCRRAQQEEE